MRSAVSLLKQVHNYLLAFKDIRLAPYLADWPAAPYQTRTVLPNRLPVVACLEALTDEDDLNTGGLIQVLKTAADALCWGQTYTQEDFGAAFLENYGWAELIGLRSPVASGQIACGFLLLGPQTEYPRHSHEAEEVYIPFTPNGRWIKGHGEWTYRRFGTPIFHKSWQTHGMRTEATPLVALYMWRGGDLVQKSLIA